MNFRNVDIRQMITVMSELTGKNFLVDDRVRGTVTLIAPQPVTPAEAYQIFLAALAMQGFTVVPQGPINKILPSQNATVQPLPTRIAPSHPRQ
jgi:general secretion pathway protein D